jgi:hypothetical protein
MRHVKFLDTNSVWNFLIRVAPPRCIVLPSPFVPYGREGARKEDAQALREFLGNSLVLPPGWDVNTQGFFPWAVNTQACSSNPVYSQPRLGFTPSWRYEYTRGSHRTFKAAQVRATLTRNRVRVQTIENF